MKLQSFCKAKDTVNKTKQEVTDWERTFTKHIFARWPIYKIYKNSRRYRQNMQIKQLKIVVEISRELSTEEFQMAHYL